MKEKIFDAQRMKKMIYKIELDEKKADKVYRYLMKEKILSDDLKIQKLILTAKTVLGKILIETMHTNSIANILKSTGILNIK